VQQLDDTAGLGGQPNAAVRIDLRKFDPDKLAGRTFKASGYVKGTRDPKGRFYYLGHDGLADNVVDVIGREGNVFDVRWTGVTTDVNYYDGSKPPTRVEIVGKFTFPDMEKWATA
jgi:hypothetical protein